MQGQCAKLLKMLELYKTQKASYHLQGRITRWTGVFAQCFPSTQARNEHSVTTASTMCSTCTALAMKRADQSVYYYDMSQRDVPFSSGISEQPGSLPPLHERHSVSGVSSAGGYSYRNCNAISSVSMQVASMRFLQFVYMK